MCTRLLYVTQLLVMSSGYNVRPVKKNYNTHWAWIVRCKIILSHELMSNERNSNIRHVAIVLCPAPSCTREKGSGQTCIVPTSWQNARSLLLTGMKLRRETQLQITWCHVTSLPSPINGCSQFYFNCRHLLGLLLDQLSQLRFLNCEVLYRVS